MARSASRECGDNWERFSSRVARDAGYMRLWILRVDLTRQSRTASVIAISLRSPLFLLQASFNEYFWRHWHVIAIVLFLETRRCKANHRIDLTTRLWPSLFGSLENYRIILNLTAYLNLSSKNFNVLFFWKKLLHIGFLIWKCNFNLNLRIAQI